MTIRRRLSLSAALAVAVAVALASAGAYIAVRAKLRGEVDSSLRQRVSVLQDLSRGISFQAPVPADAFPLPAAPGARFGGATGYVQVVTKKGDVIKFTDSGKTPSVPPDATALRAAAGKSGEQLRDRTVDGVHLRTIAAPLPRGGAVVAARPLTEVDRTLHGLLIALILITAAGIALAAGLGGLVSRAALAPVRRFTKRSESIAGTLDLGARMPVERDDELGRLARSFNTTLEALDRSVHSQRQLVADASHELRTPLASLKTNVEVLERESSLPPHEREELMRDVREQVDDLTALVSDLVDLARRGEHQGDAQEVAFDELVQAAVERARRHAPGIDFDSDIHATLVHGSPERLDRAVANLLDNAAKWTNGNGRVEVRLDAGELTVRDFGPGFDGEDLPYVFDRFYRAKAARTLPGSGLGLAIVRQVAEAHGGSVRADNAHGGGALLSLRLPA